MVGPPEGSGDCCRRARRRRSRNAAANAGSGSTGSTGRRRRRNGSVIAAPGGDVRPAEGAAGPDQQRLRGVDRAAQEGGDLRYRQVVEVAQGEGGSVLRGQALEHLLRAEGVEPDVPRVHDVLVVGQPEAALLALPAPPVVDQLVPGGADQPGGGDRTRRVDRGEEGLGGEVLGDRTGAAAGEEVAVDLGKR